MIDLADNGPIEESEPVGDRVREALKSVATERRSLGQDCGMKYVSRGINFGKLKALVEGVTIVRRDLDLQSSMPS